MRGKRLVATAEVDAGLAALSNLIIANEIVRVAVAKGHPILALFDHVLLVESVLRTPAKVDTLGAALHSISPNNRTLGSGPRVKR